MTTITAWAAKGPKQALERYDYDPGPLKPDEVEIAVGTCGICHSDLSIIDNDWGISSYPAVPGHEAIGTVVELGSEARGLKPGQRVGVGWGAGSCMHCRGCLSGDQNLCAQNVPTIVGHQGEGSITDITVRRLLGLQGALKPHQIITLMQYANTDNTFAMADHDDHIHVGFRPLYGTNDAAGKALNAVLAPSQWNRLSSRLAAIQNPTVASQPSRFSLKVKVKLPPK